MNRFLKTAVLSAAVAATAIAPLSQAHAGKRRPPPQSQQTVVMKKNNDGDALLAGILGIAIGAIVVGAIAGGQNDAPPPETNPYRHPKPSLDRDAIYGDVFGWGSSDPDAVVYDDRSYRPWSKSWYRACSIQHDTFDPRTGTYINKRGVEKFCVVDKRW